MTNVPEDARDIAPLSFEEKLKGLLVKLVHQTGASNLLNDVEDLFRKPEEDGEEKKDA